MTDDAMAATVIENLQRMVQLARFFPPIAYPPVLVFLLPVILIAIRIPKDDRFLRGAIIYAGVLLCYFFVASHFEEVRAEIPFLLMILPAALLNLRILLEPEGNLADG